MFQPLKSFAVLALLALTALAQTPRVGEPAKDFRLPSAAGASVTLKDYAGKTNVVLVFYRGYW